MNKIEVFFILKCELHVLTLSYHMSHKACVSNMILNTNLDVLKQFI